MQKMLLPQTVHVPQLNQQIDASLNLRSSQFEFEDQAD